MIQLRRNAVVPNLPSQVYPTEATSSAGGKPSLAGFMEFRDIRRVSREKIGKADAVIFWNRFSEAL